MFVCVCMCVCVYVCMRAHTCTRIHTYIHTCIQYTSITYIHACNTYIHIHIYIYIHKCIHCRHACIHYIASTCHLFESSLEPNQSLGSFITLDHRYLGAGSQPGSPRVPVYKRKTVHYCIRSVRLLAWYLYLYLLAPPLSRSPGRTADAEAQDRYFRRYATGARCGRVS